MFGLIVLAVSAAYLVLLTGVTWWGYRWAKRNNRFGGRAWVGGLIAFLAIYLPVFWDHIPTLVAHEYFCREEAGFWVYKTPDQWKQENPVVAETLVATVGASSTR